MKLYEYILRVYILYVPHSYVEVATQNGRVTDRHLPQAAAAAVATTWQVMIGRLFYVDGTEMPKEGKESSHTLHFGFLDFILPFYSGVGHIFCCFFYRGVIRAGLCLQPSTRPVLRPRRSCLSPQGADNTTTTNTG